MIFCRRTPVLLLILALLATGCSPTAQPVSRTTTRLLMGTLVSITTWSLPTNASAWEEQERQGVDAAFREVARIEGVMSSHRADSPLSRLNQAPRGIAHPLLPELADLLRRGLEVTNASGGAFDMGLDPLILLWGFSREPPPQTVPDPQRITAWLEHHAPGGLTLSGTVEQPLLRLANASHGLDLGAIAKGYALDRAVAVLQEQGIHNAIVNAGGNLRTIGAKGDRPWRLGIRHPRQAEGVMAVVEVDRPLTMVTSGDYERFFIHQDQRYHHIFDPRTGYPARSGLISVTVQAEDGTLADALSTALFVLGAEQGLALLRRFPGSEALLMLEDRSLRRSAGFIGQPVAEP
ncbi:MAG: FAD:protein FMN transferase [Magnetococcales bacterium]|nr:FAD:protein FMN transferase [Magnetococcales bacterium]